MVYHMLQLEHYEKNVLQIVSIDSVVLSVYQDSSFSPARLSLSHKPLNPSLPFSMLKDAVPMHHMLHRLSNESEVVVTRRFLLLVDSLMHTLQTPGEALVSIVSDDEQKERCFAHPQRR